MNTKVIYVTAGGIAAAAIAIFFIMGMWNIRSPANSDVPDMGQILPADLELVLNDIIVEETDDNNAEVQVVFDVRNPNPSTAILETIFYALYVDQFQMTTGDIGESPEGFVVGQENIFPIVGNTAVTLKDTQVVVRNNLTASSLDSMIDRTAQYRVEGSYTSRIIGSNLQTIYDEGKSFTFTFP